MKVSIFLLDELLQAHESGELCLDEPERQELIQLQADALRLDDHNVQERLRSFLRLRQTLAHKIGNLLITKANVFVNEELKKYARIKAQRPLTESEIEYGQRDLVALVNSITRLCSHRSDN